MNIHTTVADKHLLKAGFRAEISKTNFGIFLGEDSQFLIKICTKQRNKTAIPLKMSYYRGISLQSVIPKFFDKLLTEKITEHVQSIIPKIQHGFRRKRSTVTNLIEISQFIYENIKKGGRFDVIYFDFSKAFDRVDHGILAVKLTKIGIPLKLLNTIMSFVTSRVNSLSRLMEMCKIYHF